MGSGGGNNNDMGRIVVSNISGIPLIVAEGNGHNLTEMANRSELPLSTVPRLVTELAVCGGLECRENGRFHVGPPLAATGAPGGRRWRGSEDIRAKLAAPFVGRRVELALLGAALDRVRSGRLHVVELEGPAGCGKTSLVERFLLGKEDLQVLRASGEEWEAGVRFGVVDQLLRPAGLSSARVLGRRAGALPAEEPNEVAAQILALLGELTESGPVVLLVDDLQWADIESLRAVLFVLRRVVHEPVLALLVAREDDQGRVPQGLHRLASGRNGSLLPLGPLTMPDVRALASVAAGGDVPVEFARRLHAFTRGHPQYVRAVLAETPVEQWFGWDPVLVPPRAVGVSTRRLLAGCTDHSRGLVESVAVLGDPVCLTAAACVGTVEEPLAALDEARGVGLLTEHVQRGQRHVEVSHPVLRAAVYEQIEPALRAALHRAAIEVVDDPGAALWHRMAVTDPPDEQLADELSAFADRQAATGSLAVAGARLVDAFRMSPPGEQRERRLARAVDLLIGSGGLGEPHALAAEMAGLSPGAPRDAVRAFRAAGRGWSVEAESLLGSSWQLWDPVSDAELAAVVARWRSRHSLWRLDAVGVVEWADRAAALAESGSRIGVEAAALLGLGLAWQGDAVKGMAVHDSVLTTLPIEPDSDVVRQVRSARGVLRIAVDDLVGARADLSDAGLVDRPGGSVAQRVWACAWLSRAEFLAGEWDAAAVAAQRAVALLGECGLEWLRPLARWAAVGVPAARGQWRAAQEHALLASAQSGDYDAQSGDYDTQGGDYDAQGGDYELMIVAAGLARGQLAAARGDHQEVLQALEPLLAIEPRDGIDEPGFWGWQELYGDALVSAGRWEHAAAFLAPHEQLAAARGRRSSVAMLARVRGRLEAAAGRTEAAEAAFTHGLAKFAELSLPFPQASLQLAYGQMLRRAGHRRAAAEQLQSAHTRFAELERDPTSSVASRNSMPAGWHRPSGTISTRAS